MTTFADRRCCRGKYHSRPWWRSLSPELGVDDVDYHTPPSRVSFIGRPAQSRPADVAAMLRAMADVAAGFTEQLDLLRDSYPAREQPRADPVLAVLDQAAAAANDLHNGASTAAALITAGQATANQHQLPT